MYQILPMDLFTPFTLTLFSVMIMMSTIHLTWSMKLKKAIKKKKGKKNSGFLSLFLSFDPKCNMKFLFFDNLNWIIIIMIVIILMDSFWTSEARLTKIWKKMKNKLTKQFEIALKSKKDSSSLLFLSLFTLIILSNTSGLIPYVFTSSSHMMFNMFISLSTWLGFMLFGWMNFTNKMFSHLVPLSTPKPLISFMVSIETISNLIRPGTLSIRLMANMVSGHLLLTLMGNTMNSNKFLIILVLILIQSLLTILELSVSIIQAYVFCMLLSLYSDESDHPNN